MIERERRHRISPAGEEHDPDAIRGALLKTNYNGILGNVKFDANNQSHNNVMYMLVENGKLGVKDLVAGQ